MPKPPNLKELHKLEAELLVLLDYLQDRGLPYTKNLVEAARRGPVPLYKTLFRIFSSKKATTKDEKMISPFFEKIYAQMNALEQLRISMWDTAPLRKALRR